MPTVTLHANKSAIIDHTATNSNDHTSASTKAGTSQYLAVGFEELPQAYWFNKLERLLVYVYVNSSAELFPDKISVHRYLSEFDAGSITFNTKPKTDYLTQVTVLSSDYPGYCYGFTDQSWGNVPLDAVRYGCQFRSYDCSMQTSHGSNKPYLEITFKDTIVGLQLSDLTPSAGAVVLKKKPASFSWKAAVSEDDQCYKDVEVKSTVFRWKGESGSVHTINAGSALSVEIPANTFSEDSIQWQVEVTANSGAVTTSDWVTVSTVEMTSSAVTVSPKNTVIDGSATNVFAWEHVIETGTDQTAFDLQTSTDGSSWTTLQARATADTFTEVPGATFSSGSLYWRVRTYNSDNKPGQWSEPAHCIVIAAPATPAIVVSDGSPRFAIRWQQSGQQAYELMIDGSVIAKTFSAESFYRHGGYLEPGMHTVRVRIQNKYQLWSEWGTASLQIENVEGAAIQLSASGNNEVGLSWSTSGNYAGYIVYRNGVKIAETAETAYVDHFAVGEAVYQVRGVYADSGNYTLSNVAAVTVSPETLLIACVSDPVWIKLPLSTSSLRSAGLSASQSVTYTHYIGSGLPGVEIGEAVSKSYDLDCAFKVTDLGRIRQFESLLGKVVCIKTPSQRRIVGVLSQMTARENRFYVTYSVPVTEVRWEEMEV